MTHPPTGTPGSPAATSAEAPGQLRRVALSGLLGTAIEFYDFLVYGTVAALVFGDLFFPEADPAVGTVAAFGTFAAGYLARPLGGIVFGHFGDRLGRKSMMLLTMVLMGAGSFLIGLLPTYDAIGVWAPVLLVLLRVVQGIAIGGEWGGATLMVAEHAGDRPRGLWTSFTQLGAPLGMVLSTGVVTLVSTLPDDDFRAWGWRVPFLLSVLLLGAGLYIRLKVTESPLFASLTRRRERARMPLLEVLRAPRPVLLASAVGIGPFTAQALMTSFMISYAVDEGYTRPQVLTGVTVASCVALVVLPCANLLSDRFGRRPLVLAGALLSAATAFPVFALVDSHRPGLLILACVIGHGIAQSVMYGPLGALFSEMFSTRVRYTGASLGYQTATLLGAGFSPLIAGGLLAAHDSSDAVALLLTGGAAITALAVWRVKETNARDLAAQATPLAAPGASAASTASAEPAESSESSESADSPKPSVQGEPT